MLFDDYYSYELFWGEKQYHSRQQTWDRLVSNQVKYPRFPNAGFRLPAVPKRGTSSDSAELYATSREGAML